MEPLDARLKVVIEMYPPDLRLRDVDNISKAALDGLTSAGVWLDDALIDDLRIIRREKVKNGKLIVRIEELKLKDKPHETDDS